MPLIPSQTESARPPILTRHVLVALGAAGFLLLILFGAGVWMLARYTGSRTIPIGIGPVAINTPNGVPMVNTPAPRPPGRARPPAEGFVLDDAAKAVRQRALAQIPDATGNADAVAALRRVAVPMPPTAVANGRAVALPTPVRMDVAVAGTGTTPAQPAGRPAQPAGRTGAYVLDAAAQNLRQRALSQIPAATGTTDPLAPLRRIAITMPPPGVANARATALPTPVRIAGAGPAPAAAAAPPAAPSTGPSAAIPITPGT